MNTNAEDLPTPPLRDDLDIAQTHCNSEGEPVWVLHDSVTNRFFRIGWLEFECLLRWEQTPRRIAEQIAEQTALKPDPEQVLGFRAFLERHQLVRPGAQALERLRQASEGRQWLTWKWWLHHYLFFRIPLMHPQRHLRRLAQGLGWLFHPVTGLLVVSLGLLGIVLVAHQWDTFRHDVVESFSTEGLLSFALALVVAKTLHELGHALVATRLGLKVAHMGIAFVVMWPMLYTDTGESWKLRSPRQRLAISSAGILTELGLAGLATLGWALCDPGPLRNALLYLATTSWALSLALNASPFMRFDGYFILSDLLDFPNLHERATAVAKVTLRRTLLGLDEPWPEPFPAARRRLLVAFALLTWVYRLVLFLGIAVTVYLFFFKLLGIFLFAVEIAWFILQPIWRELKHWWRHRKDVRPSRRHLLWGALAVVLLLVGVPWRSQIHAVGLARAEHQLRLYAPFPAMLQEMREAGAVQAGQTLVVLSQPDITTRLVGNEAGMRGYSARLAGLLADPAGLAEAAATRQRYGVQYQEVRAARSEIARLNLKAPFTGRWLDLNPDWHSGQWIGTREALGVLIDPRSWQVDAYVGPDDLQRLQEGSPVRFYPEGVPQAISGRVLQIGTTRISQLAQSALASRHGGPLEVVGQGDALVPAAPLFHLLVQLDAPPPTLHETRGHLQIEGQRRSLLANGLMHLAAVFMRESGF
ncbi:HlyD family efflux transporter periplasmic adaptor subunit [Pseudomonas guariconensis]|uniref:site-2 protease family protein n=1 Tax=Pseudomonas TaxID=286 RepID=UPI0020970A19|nr:MULTISPECIES: site-2 protease family protein [Pseudomonas]MCO7639379.1 HlyD family efflux transporter periplasmic adaptor subunit [Pseudomonas sp. S 311-6]MCO7515155.1 HlyD family efflux transporter periplasmic adaptor subunit [Pseudomonas putida]MCO7565083.1 HlyD family efflux transporter periplasmic adaptor subunit [Pseudomonas mosselii]MCO7605032.1 HlyD family efflux transporter periplasmic adaptor subunit [Pseudomonas guariconensis]MCO7616318.1 HlyD family efflux transporter periplasmic